MNSAKNRIGVKRAARLGGFTTAAAMLAGTFAALPALAQQPEPWQMNLQEPHSTLMEQMVEFHDFLLYLIFGISIFVLGLLLFTVVRFNEKRHPTPSKTTHNTLIEVAWSVLPIFILMVIGLFSLPLLFASDDTVDADLTVKVIGRQWYWSYEYPDHGDFTFDAFMIPDDEIREGQLRLLSTDENLVLPVGKKIRVLVTASDVLHAFAMPALGSPKFLARRRYWTTPGNRSHSKRHASWVRSLLPSLTRTICSEESLGNTSTRRSTRGAMVASAKYTGMTTLTSKRALISMGWRQDYLPQVDIGHADRDFTIA